jgi:hypothetical protein
MARSYRNVVLLAKLETTAGTDAAPTNTADAVLLFASNLKINVTQLFAERDVLRGHFGAPDQLPYTRRGKVDVSVDLAGSGTLGLAPAWGDLLLACAMSETVAAGASVTYLPASTNLKSLTLWAFVDGLVIKMFYGGGSFKSGLKPGAAPTLDFSFTALVSDPAAATLPTPTLTPWKRSVAAGPVNTSALSIGAVTQTAGVLSGGTQYNFNDFSVDMGNDVQDLVLVREESVSIYGRAPKASATLDLSAAADVTMFANMKAGTAVALGVTQGITAGERVTFYAPNAIITNVEHAPQGNVLLTKLDFDLLPSSSGNDELRLVCI